MPYKLVAAIADEDRIVPPTGHITKKIALRLRVFLQRRTWNFVLEVDPRYQHSVSIETL